MQTQQRPTTSKTRQRHPLENPIWKKITPEEIAIRSELKAHGCQIKKLPKRPVWVVTRRDYRFELHYLPRTEEWLLLPTEPTPMRDRLMLQIEKALAKVGSGR